MYQPEPGSHLSGRGGGVCPRRDTGRGTMRILLLNADPMPPVERRHACATLLRGVASALLRAGHLVDCGLAAQSDHAELSPLATRGLSLHVLPSRPSREPMDRLFAACRPDLVIEHLAPIPPHGSESAAASGITHLYEITAPFDDRSLAPGARNGSADWRSWLARGLAASRGGVSQSPEAADWARQQAASEFEVALIASGGELEPVSTARREWARATIAPRAGEFVVGFSGSFKPWHDLETLVLAVARLRSRVPARLVLAGDGPARNTLLALAVKHQVPAVFAGGVSKEESRALLEHCDVLAVPYARAGADFSPLKLVEAMTAGRPIVATETGPTRRLLAEGATGLLVPAGDVPAFAQALERLASQPALREKIAQAASRRAVEHYSWDVAVERVLAFAAACRTRAEHCA